MDSISARAAHPAAATETEQAIAYLLSLQGRGMKLDLDRMRAALRDLGRPDAAFPCFLVAGTNGKGSTASALASILQRPGRRVGLFTSPHLIDFRERIRVDATLIASEAVTERVGRERAVWDRHQLTFFEATTALALTHFRAVGVDVAVLEVGLGGRLDATNCVEPVVSVITPIGRDHVHILGDRLHEIAGEKAGILRRGAPAVLAGGLREATGVLESRARALGAPIYFRPRRVTVREIQGDGERTRFRLSARASSLGRDASAGGHSAGLDEEAALRPGFLPLDLEVRLPGTHQVANATLAALAAMVPSPLPTTPADIVTGLGRWRWPGRLERPVPGLPLVFDCGHNREGGRVLASALARIAQGRPIELVAGMVEKKDHEGFFLEMSRVVDHVTIAPPATERAATREALESAARAAGLTVRPAASIAEGLERALKLARDPDGPLAVLAGSLFVLEEGYRFLGVPPAECLWPSAPVAQGAGA